MNTIHDEIQDGESFMFELTAKNFVHWTLLNGYITPSEIEYKPYMIADLLFERWTEFKDDMEEAYLNAREDERIKWKD